MGLREQFTTDTTMNTTGCRLLRWLNNFEGDDRVFLIEQLESGIATDPLMRWFRRQALTPIGKDAVNDHRNGRCECPAGVEGVR